MEDRIAEPMATECQDHVCTAVIEEVCALTPESAWDDLEDAPE